MHKTLKEVLPAEFLGGEYHETRAYELKDYPVVTEVDGCEPGQGWPGKHTHVLHWYVLVSGHIVGFNENPSRGWSFPVMRPKQAVLANLEAALLRNKQSNP